VTALSGAQRLATAALGHADPLDVQGGGQAPDNAFSNNMKSLTINMNRAIALYILGDQ
jgi:hypothetical protein